MCVDVAEANFGNGAESPYRHVVQPVVSLFLGHGLELPADAVPLLSLVGDAVEALPSLGCRVSGSPLLMVSNFLPSLSRCARWKATQWKSFFFVLAAIPSAPSDFGVGSRNAGFAKSAARRLLHDAAQHRIRWLHGA